MIDQCFRLKFFSRSQGVQKAFVQTCDLEGLELACADQGLSIVTARHYSSWLYALMQMGSDKGVDIILATQALVQLLKGGIPLHEAMKVLVNMNVSPKIKVMACDLVRSLLQGQSFSQSARHYPKFFDVVYIGLLENAEQRGRYVQALEDALNYLKTRENLRQQMVKAISYPLVLLGMSLGLLSFLCVSVLPELVQFIQSFTTDLPFSTRVLIALSHSYETVLTGTIGILGACILVGIYGEFISRKVTYGRDLLMLRLPVYGQIFYLRHLSIFFTTLAALGQGGQKLSWAFQIATDQMTNNFLKQQFQNAQHSLLQGASLDRALSQVYKMPTYLLKILQVGLKASRLQENLELIIQDLNTQLNRQIERFMAYLQPCLLVIVGGLFLWIVVSIFLPIYQTLGVMA